MIEVRPSKILRSHGMIWCLVSVVQVPLLHQVDMTFPYMPCSWLSLDTMDISGDLHLDVVGA